MLEEKEKLIKKGVVVAVNTLMGGLLGGGIGALIGAMSSVDDGAIGAAVDKLIKSSNEKIVEKDTTDNVNKA